MEAYKTENIIIQNCLFKNSKEIIKLSNVRNIYFDKCNLMGQYITLINTDIEEVTFRKCNFNNPVYFRIQLFNLFRLRVFYRKRYKHIF